MILDRIDAAMGGWEPEDLSIRTFVEEERIIVASDVQIPYFDRDLMRRMFHIAKALRIEAIVWLGDLMDMPIFSSFGVDDPTTTVRRASRGSPKRCYAKRQSWASGNTGATATTRHACSRSLLASCRWSVWPTR